MNANYTHTFSKATYSHTLVGSSGFPFFQTEFKDTTYADRLINMPKDLVNISFGYDYRDFSIVLFMNYQSGILQRTHFFNSLRNEKNDQLRVDLAARQKLPWYNAEIFLNVLNLTNEFESVFNSGNGYSTGMETYGRMAQVGVLINLN